MVLWVFGYGSLIWKPSFGYEERVVGYVKGYRRAFHQACVDFRGTAQRPGRTATLERHEGAVTWGVAYRVTASAEARMVEAYLDRRERTYDVRKMLPFYVPSGAVAVGGGAPAAAGGGGVMTYIATAQSVWYLGPAPLPVMARQIARSRGVAGDNHEYLFRLEASLVQLGAGCLDHETRALADEVRAVLARRVLRMRPRALAFRVADDGDSQRRLLEKKAQSREDDPKCRTAKAAEVDVVVSFEAVGSVDRKHRRVRVTEVEISISF